MLASLLSVPIMHRLWRNQQNVSITSETQRSCVKILFFVVSYGSITSCTKQTDVCSIVTNCLWVNSRGSLVFMFLNSSVKLKTTLSWGHKRFVVPIHTLFSIQSRMLKAMASPSDQAGKTTNDTRITNISKFFVHSIHRTSPSFCDGSITDEEC